MNNVKSVSSFLFYYKYFKREAGNKLIIFLFVSLMASLLEGVGITAMLPLLSVSFYDGISDDLFSRAFSGIFGFIDMQPTFNRIIGLIIIIFFIKFIISLVQKVIQAFIAAWLGEKLKIKYALAYKNMKYKYYLSTEVGYFNNILTTETGGAVAGFIRFSEAITSLCNFFVYICFSFLVNWYLTLLVLIFGGVIVLLYKQISRVVTQLSYANAKLNAEKQNVFLQFVAYYKYLKATSNTAMYLNHLMPLLRKSRIFAFKTEVYKSFTSVSFEFLRVLMVSVIVFYMVSVEGNKLTEIMVPMLLITRSFGALLAVQVQWQNFKGKTGSIKILEEARRDLEYNKELNSNNADIQFKHNIKLKHICFSFEKNNIINDITFSIEKGKCIGIAGVSGSGKTTMVDLITGLLEPDKGVIEIDGVAYNKLDKNKLRSNFGYVTQEPIVFNDTIENNISFWDKAEGVKVGVKSAMNLTGCNKFVSTFPDKEQSSVGDKGVRLSGGQRQRISIAREVYRNSKIIIFDEATASLDSAAEAIIQDSINKLKGDKTIIVIAHRLSTLKVCDEIVVLGDGKIVEQGDWNTLIEKNGIFASMCRKQEII